VEKKSKLHDLSKEEFGALKELADKKCEAIDATDCNNIKMKEVLTNKVYCDKSAANCNDFQKIYNQQHGSESTSYVTDAYKEIKELIINATNQLLAIYPNSQEISIVDCIVNFIKKIEEFLSKNKSNEVYIMFMLNNIKCCLMDQNKSNAIKILEVILTYADSCEDKAYMGLQLASCLAIAYNSNNSNTSIEGVIISILIDLYKRNTLSQSLAKQGNEELEGIAYLTQYTADIVFPGITMPSYLYHALGRDYTEDNGDPINNLDKVLDRINNKERLVGFICAGVYDGVDIGEEIFEKIVLKDDQEYQGLLKQEKDANAAVNDIEEYNNLIGEAYESGDYSKAEAYRENFLKDKAEAVINYKRKKAEELLRKYDYIY
jgi:hypothetical protein